MPSWRFSSAFSRNRESLVDQPPRYSNLSQSASPDARSNSHGRDGTTGNADTRSIASLGSQITLPTYTPVGDFMNRPASMSPSMTTLSRPPGYDTISVLRSRNTTGDALDSGYAFTISSGFKSKPWATLRLHDGEMPGATPRPPKQGRHPRFSSLDTMVGSVELSLTSPQTIKTIELLLKGSMITGVSEDGGSTSFLEHRYTLWDRKFGNPRHLASGGPSDSQTYDGKLLGDWVFPFAIPFPTHVDLSTRCAVHARGSEGPVRFLPEFRDPALTPFPFGGLSRDAQRRSYDPSNIPETITPFDLANHRTVIGEKGERHSTPISSSSQGAPPSAAPVSLIPTSQERAAPNIPSLEPYTASPHEETEHEPDLLSGGHPTKYRSRNQLSDEPVERLAPNAPGRRPRHHRRPSSTPGLDLPLSATSYPLPPSFLERDVMANVHYELSLVITHGNLLSTESRVKTIVVYSPVTTPPPLPLDRQISLRQRVVPRDPCRDPDMWKQLPPALMRGLYLDQHAVAVEYKLHLPSPLSYARGTPIPCTLTIACESPAALNFFANPRTPRVRLKRLVWFFQNKTGTDISDARNVLVDSSLGRYSNTRPGVLFPPMFKVLDHPQELAQQRNPPFLPVKGSPVESFVPDVDDKDDKDFLGLNKANQEQVIGEGAVWCAPEQYAQEPQVKRLYGEIHLPKGLQPTCTFPLFKIAYRIELLAPATSAFVPDSSGSPSKGADNFDEHVYASRFVDITSDTRRDEPRPVPLVGSLARPRLAPTEASPSHPQYPARYGWITS